MKKFKKIFGFIFAIAVLFTSVVSAKAIDKTITFTSSVPYNNSEKFLNAGTTFKKAKFSNGKEVYALCFNHKKDAPPIGTVLNIRELNNNEKGKYLPAYVYILDNGIGGTWNESLMGASSSFTEKEKYYVTQLALWGVLYQYDQTSGVSIEAQVSDQNYNKLSASLQKIKTAAIKLRDAALKSTVTEPTIKISNSKDMYETSDKKYYRSDDYTVGGSGFATYTVNLVNAPSDVELVEVGTNTVKKSGASFAAGKKFYIRIPSNKIGNGLSIDVKVTASATKRELAIYKYNDVYQDIGVAYSTPKTLNAETKVAVKKLTGGIKVTKVYTNAAGVSTNLDGVKLQLIDSNGKVHTEWTTSKTENPKTITGLNVGETYTIHEVSAPSGYTKAADQKVTIEANKIIERTIVNTKTETIQISKQDATTGEELPGASLVLKDSLGTTIEEWVSGTTPHIVKKKLNPGRYCLTETMQPEGFQLSKETVCFNVNDDGGVDEQVVMLNKPKTSVKISKQDITTKKELPGAKLTVKNSAGEVVDEWISGTEPHYLPDLPEGKYKLIEVTAPEGYGISEEVIEFEITADGIEKTIVMTNEKIPVTADMNITMIAIGLVITVILVGFSLFKLNKQQDV